MGATRRRPLKTVTGVSGSAEVYGAAVDPGQSTAASAIEIAKLAEANGFDALFAADLLSFGAQGAIGAQEPLIFLSALSAVTTHVGLIATVTTTFHHPYNLARLFGTLDHVSNGRAAWNAVTSSLGEENYGDQDLPSPEERYERATESLEVVNALFDSWRPGALTPDGHGGAILDADLVRPIDYEGKHFTVRGPLNIPPLPQRRPVQFQAGQSEAGIELGARFAEVVFTSLPTLDDAITYTKKIRARAAELGRADGLPLIMSSFHATYGASEAEVRQLVRERAEATDFDAGRIALADMLGGGIDLSELPLDQPIPEQALPELRSIHRRRGRAEIFSGFARSGKTLRELIIAAKDTGHWAAAGTPEQLADAIAERYDAGVLDVLSVGGLAEPRTRDFLLNGLLPELRRRNIIGTDYLGATFRDNLELPPLPTI
ncbi:NtaA/DmoA family FMN-dependent monooxygenase [Nocardia sp. NPDC051052]|uniref:NtaA/DmoA family FMN-dependent monooxygenase n=1 Tax=Nocardia sp. NPDC051052 TaxID=3364322 RepID=UPI0037BBAA61